MENHDRVEGGSGGGGVAALRQMARLLRPAQSHATLTRAKPLRPIHPKRRHSLQKRASDAPGVETTRTTAMRYHVMKPTQRQKPASMSVICAQPHRRPARRVPSPGKASWLMRTQTRGVTGLGVLRTFTEDVFVGVHQRESRERPGDQHADHARQGAQQIEQARHE